MAAADFVCDAIRAFEKSNGPEDSFERAGLEGGGTWFQLFLSDLEQTVEVETNSQRLWMTIL